MNKWRGERERERFWMLFISSPPHRVRVEFIFMSNLSLSTPSGGRDDDVEIVFKIAEYEIEENTEAIPDQRVFTFLYDNVHVLGALNQFRLSLDFHWNGSVNLNRIHGSISSLIRSHDKRFAKSPILVAWCAHWLPFTRRKTRLLTFNEIYILFYRFIVHNSKPEESEIRRSHRKKRSALTWCWTPTPIAYRCKIVNRYMRHQHVFDGLRTTVLCSSFVVVFFVSIFYIFVESVRHEAECGSNNHRLN